MPSVLKNLLVLGNGFHPLRITLALDLLPFERATLSSGFLL